MMLLVSKFPKRRVWFIAPAFFNGFSHYKNFLETDNIGSPISMKKGINSWEHLNKLLENAKNKLKIPLKTENLSLIGFSKGCVVLN